MTKPKIEAAPKRDYQSDIVFKTDDNALERVRQIVLAAMESMSVGCNLVPDEYQGWSDFLGLIEAEQRRRRRREGRVRLGLGGLG